MTNVLGIDHPLVCVHDIAVAQETYRRLGFKMKGIGKHPWGTSTCAMIFEKSLLELMGIYDTSLIDGYPAGDFRFGRFIHEALQQREGIALTALYSEDVERDAKAVEGRGGVCQGTIEFGRDVVLADGAPHRTSTTLKIFRSDRFPRLSNFACQQHKRHLIEYPEWMDHPNSAYGFHSIAILAEADQQAGVLDWLGTIHGREGITRENDGFHRVKTDNGNFLVMDRANASKRYGPIPQSINDVPEPFEFAVDVKVKSIATVKSVLNESGFTPTEIDGRLVLSQAEALGGILLSFIEV
ncbi:VOC family protein [Rhizobium rhizogenes]|uniref:VOC family protein n=1 Tax=Rhizobium rhizogenes TaxID=359 RepID=UPI0015717B64|nr:VOC family protein [Rhizobium rhizogenes]NTH22826.1 VOC family protein [Rhizobium rhizogenes]NTH35856.1 VOC family protein [Rhizobium rhizogenes]